MKVAPYPLFGFVHLDPLACVLKKPRSAGNPVEAHDLWPRLETRVAHLYDVVVADRNGAGVGDLRPLFAAGEPALASLHLDANRPEILARRNRAEFKYLRR